MNPTLVRLLFELARVGAIKIGEFTLKSGRISPVYVDLRGLVSHPEVLRLVGQVLAEKLKPLQFDRIAGLPYAGIPLAVATAMAGGLPALYSRKEVKDYGTKKAIEGDYKPGMTVVFLDDVITDGGAKLDLLPPFQDAGLIVRDVVVLCDREQGGAAALQEAGLNLHAVFTLREAFVLYRESGTFSYAECGMVLSYLNNPEVWQPAPMGS